jgi:hypothetical protein
VIAAIPTAHDILVVKRGANRERCKCGADEEKCDVECAHDMSNETEISHGRVSWQAR